MKAQKPFNFSEFMSFADNLVETLQQVSDKIDEVTTKVDTLEEALGGNSENIGESEVPEAAPELPESEASVGGAEEEPVQDNDQAAIDAMGGKPVEAPAPEAPEAEENKVEVSVDVPKEESTETPADESVTEPAVEPETDKVEGNEQFSYIVVGRKERPWGNCVIERKEFSEAKYRQVIPTTFATKEQAQRALTSYNINGENFSIRYQHVKGILNM